MHTGTSVTLVLLASTIYVCIFSTCVPQCVTSTKFIDQSYGVQGSQPKRNWFCNFDCWRCLVYFCFKIMLRRCTCICCAVTCKKNGLPFQRVLGKIASEPNETKRMLVWLVLPNMQSVLGQACLIPIGLTEGKLRKKDFFYLVWAWSGAVAHTLLQRVHDTC